MGMVPHERMIESGELAKRVYESLQGLGHKQFVTVQCSAVGNRVELRGSVVSFYQKQLAQTIAAKVAGVHQVKNHLEVTDSPAKKPR
jgi:osmotically-inducible protein OsmY